MLKTNLETEQVNYFDVYRAKIIAPLCLHKSGGHQKFLWGIINSVGHWKLHLMRVIQINRVPFLTHSTTDKQIRKL